MGGKEKRYSLPDRYIVIPRDDWFIFFDPVHFSYTRVNDHGKAILEAVGKETAAGEVARKVAADLCLDPSEVEDRVSAFLDNMTSTGFIHEGPYKPEVEEPPDMDKSRPGSLYIHPTFRCNLQCIYCYNKKERKELGGGAELNTGEWFDVMDQAKDFKVEQIVFTGGEPLLRKDIFELAKYANSIGMSSQLLTNALLINEGNIDRITSTFGSVGLSLDSHIKEKNDFQRGRGAYESTINAIKLLEKNKHEYNVTVVVTKHNVLELPGLYKFLLEELGCVKIFPNLYIPTSRETVDLLPGLEDYLEATDRANRMVEDFYGEDKLSVLTFHGTLERKYHCGAAAGEISMGPDGTVYPCQALQKKEFSAGSIKDQGLKEIYYDSPILKKFRHCTVDNIEVCRDCDVKNLCGGGCRSLAYNLFGKIDCHNSYSCEYLKSLAHGMLWNSSCIPIDQLRKMREESRVEAESKV